MLHEAESEMSRFSLKQGDTLGDQYLHMSLGLRSKALWVMNCLLDVSLSQVGIAVVKHGTATAAIL